MRCFSSELGNNYSTYSFGYCNYACLEAGDTLSDFYTNGFLPYTGAHLETPTAYMARSLRVPLPNWSMSSENRRIFAKFSELSRSVSPVSSSLNQEAMLDFCEHYFHERHQNAGMSRERLDYILRSGWVSHIATYQKDSTLLGYVWLGEGPQGRHFYFSFYDLAHIHQSLGLWLMLNEARIAKEEGLPHIYLGTAYGEKGLYKTNFTPLEYWDGSRWSDNRTMLRTLCRNDHAHTLTIMDDWKKTHDRF